MINLKAMKEHVAKAADAAKNFKVSFLHDCWISSSSGSWNNYKSFEIMKLIDSLLLTYFTLNI